MMLLLQKIILPVLHFEQNSKENIQEVSQSQINKEELTSVAHLDGSPAVDQEVMGLISTWSGNIFPCRHHENLPI